MKVFLAIWHLMQGLGITMLNFLRPKVTEQYPENRATKVHFERFRAEVVMPHDTDNHHRCTACGICAATCPNKTIEVLAAKNEEGKRVLDKHLYDVGSCMFCGLCVAACPFGAIEFDNRFEHAVFTRGTLIRQLNKPGSSLKPRHSEPPKGGVETASEASPRGEKRLASLAGSTPAPQAAQALNDAIL